MPLHKSRFKYFLEGKPEPIPLCHYPMVVRKCNACGHDSATGIDMTPDTDNPKLKRYVEARCAECGIEWGAFSREEKPQKETWRKEK